MRVKIIFQVDRHYLPYLAEAPGDAREEREAAARKSHGTAAQPADPKRVRAEMRMADAVDEGKQSRDSELTRLPKTFPCGEHRRRWAIWRV
jgi:hypothetical protein